MSLSEISFLRGIVHDNDAEKIDLDRKNNSLKIGIVQEEERFQHAIEISFRNSERLNESCDRLTKTDSDLDFSSLTLNQLNDDQKNIISQLCLDSITERITLSKFEVWNAITFCQQKVSKMQAKLENLSEKAKSCSDEMFEGENKTLNNIVVKKTELTKDIDDMQAHLNLLRYEVTQSKQRRDDKFSNFSGAINDKDILILTFKNLQNEVLDLENALTNQTAALELLKFDAFDKMSALQDTLTESAKDLETVLSCIEVSTTDKSFLNDKLSLLMVNINEQCSLLNELNLEVDKSQAELRDRSNAKEVLVTELQQVRMQISSMPKNDAAADQSRYFADKVDVLDGEISQIQGTLEGTTNKLAQIHRQLSQEEEHAVLTPLLQQSAAQSAQCDSVTLSVEDSQRRNTADNLIAATLNAQLNVVIARSREGELELVTKTFEEHFTVIVSQSEALHAKSSKHCTELVAENGDEYIFSRSGVDSPHHSAQRVLWLRSEHAVAEQSKRDLQEVVFHAENDLAALRGALDKERGEAEKRVKEKMKSERLQKFRETVVSQHASRMQIERDVLLAEDRAFQQTVQQAETAARDKKACLTDSLQGVEELIASTGKQIEEVERNREQLVRDAAQAATAAAQSEMASATAPALASSAKQTRASQKTQQSPPPQSQTSHTIEEEEAEEEEEDAADDMSEWMVQDDKYHVPIATAAPQKSTPVRAGTFAAHKTTPKISSTPIVFEEEEEEEDENYDTDGGGTVDFQPTGGRDSQSDADDGDDAASNLFEEDTVLSVFATRKKLAPTVERTEPLQQQQQQQQQSKSPSAARTSATLSRPPNMTLSSAAPINGIKDNFQVPSPRNHITAGKRKMSSAFSQSK